MSIRLFFFFFFFFFFIYSSHSQIRKSNSTPMIVMVLDEIDQLETRNKSVLYKVFSWAQKQGSLVVLVGIANGLDLTERVLPMLKGLYLTLTLSPLLGFLFFVSFFGDGCCIKYVFFLFA